MRQNMMSTTSISHQMVARIVLAGILVAFAAAGWVTIPTEAATTIVVNTTLDLLANDGQCSLREAVIAANTDTASGAQPGECDAGSGADTITFSASLNTPATFALTLHGAGDDIATSGDLDISGTLLIQGAGAANTIVSGDLSDRVFHVMAGARATIDGVKITNGNPGAISNGGGVMIDVTGRMTITNSLVSGNTAASGGGVMVLGLLNASNTTFQGNSQGGVSNDGGLLTFNNVNFLDNSSAYALDNLNAGVLQYTAGTISGNTSGGIHNASGAKATLSQLSVFMNSGGSGIHNEGATSTKLTLTLSEVMTNTATSGGGLLNDGIGANATVVDTTLRDNIASSGGGGVNNSGTIDISRSAIFDNQARSGGGIDHNGSTLKLTNVTLTGNTATDNGGGIHNRSSATLLNVTITQNASGTVDTGGNIFNDGDTSTMQFRNTIVANAGIGGNCVNNVGNLTSLGNNLEDTHTCNFIDASDWPSTNPLLETLQSNGGPTKTQALLGGSPAIDHGSAAGFAASDQRGLVRPQGLASDIGAYEYISGSQADLAITQIDTPDPVGTSELLTYTITISNVGPHIASSVLLTDTLPAGVTLMGGAGSGWSCSPLSGKVVCSLPNLGVGATAPPIVIVVSTPGTAGLINNSVSVVSQATDPYQTNNLVQISTQVNQVYRIFLPLTVQ